MNFMEKLRHYLCPAGEGVYTVHTAQEIKHELQQKLYQCDISEVEAKWSESLSHFPDNRSPILLGICSDNGGGIMRGANWGPLFVRDTLYQNYQDHRFYDIGDIKVIPHLLLDEYLNDKTLRKCRKALYHDENAPLAVSPLSITEQVTDLIYQNDAQAKLICIGGDHSVSYPLIKSYLKNKREQGVNVAIIHFDAHTDLLIQRLGIDICFGSWAYHILQYLSSPSHLIQIGLRSSAHDKKYWQENLGVQQFWADEIKVHGVDWLLQALNEFFNKNDIDEIYITFDIDSIDSQYVSATGTPEPNGLKPEDVFNILNALKERCNISGADIVEVAPYLKTFKGDKTVKIAAKICHFLLNS